MPGFDGTGPANQGPMTGKGRGLCIVALSNAKESLPSYHIGRGLRCSGRGFRGGWREHSDHFRKHVTAPATTDSPDKSSKEA